MKSRKKHGGTVRSQNGPGVYTWRDKKRFTKFYIGESFHPERRRSEHNSRCRAKENGRSPKQGYIYANKHCENYDVPLEDSRVKIGKVRRLQRFATLSEAEIRKRLRKTEREEARLIFRNHHWPYSDASKHLLNHNTKFMQ